MAGEQNRKSWLYILTERQLNKDAEVPMSQEVVEHDVMLNEQKIAQQRS